VMNTVGTGKSTMMMWVMSPSAAHIAGTQVWQSEQDTAAMHIGKPRSTWTRSGGDERDRAHVQPPPPPPPLPMRTRHPL